MNTDLDNIFAPLPYGFCRFDDVRPYLLDVRSAKRIPDNAATVICFLFPYYLGAEYYKDSDLSRYAVSEDYHITAAVMLDEICGRLRAMFPGNVFVHFADSSPLPEVRCAVACGLGVIGRNRLCINRDYGSWFFIGEIVTDLTSGIEYSAAAPDECVGCGRCISACPTGALSETGLDTQRCLSYLTQKKGELDPQTEALMKKYNCAWGCDVCQTVCPMNTGKKVTPIKRFFDTARPRMTLQGDTADRAYLWRGRAPAQRNIDVMNGDKGENGNETDNCDSEQ